MTYADPIISSPIGMLTYLNTVTHDMFWSLVVMAIFVITYISLSMYSFKNAILPSMYSTVIATVLFYSLGLVASWLVVSLMILTAIVTLYVYFAKSEERG